jgi:hypothetical protein
MSMGRFNNLDYLLQEGLLTPKEYKQEFDRAYKEYDDLRYDSIEYDNDDDE